MISGALLILTLLYVLSIVFIVLDITLIDVYKNKKNVTNIFGFSYMFLYFIWDIYARNIN